MSSLRATIVVMTALTFILVGVGCRTVSAQNNTVAPQGAETDPRIAANPLLAELYQRAPATLPGVLRDLDQITANTGPMLRFRSAPLEPTPGEAAQIRANPDIERAYEVNPDPMLVLLRRMMEALKKEN